jgi:phosphoenolpyruvate-protein kinase (PTS system EI component)
VPTRLRYDVTVNARDGISELKQLGKAGKQAGTDIEDGMKDAESAGKQAAKALVQAAQDIATELKSDKEAADALARALGPELAAKTDTGAVVTELKSIGLT